MKDHSLVLAEVREKVYENYQIELNKIQVLFAKGGPSLVQHHVHSAIVPTSFRLGQDWMASRSMDLSPLHILEPLTIAVNLQKCMVTNDAALPL